VNSLPAFARRQQNDLQVLDVGFGRPSFFGDCPTSRYDSVVAKLKDWARAVKRDVHAVYLAARDPRVPWYAKALAVCVAGYALSPIDLIPDFIPVVGYLDDLIIVPLGIVAVVKLIPPEIMAEHRAAAAVASERPISRAAAVAIVFVWTASIALVAWLGYHYWTRRS
jgi:uncharacterized membrane protein YkvA (DUF1232 family)